MSASLVLNAGWGTDKEIVYEKPKKTNQIFYDNGRN